MQSPWHVKKFIILEFLEIQSPCSFRTRNSIILQSSIIRSQNGDTLRPQNSNFPARKIWDAKGSAHWNWHIEIELHITSTLKKFVQCLYTCIMNRPSDLVSLDHGLYYFFTAFVFALPATRRPVHSEKFYRREHV